MLSINTNIPSLIAQRSLNNSTKLLNQAIERMTTGFKINHASDNAANYSITTNMNTKLSSYQVAEDNVAMGLDLLSTAGGSLDLISDKLTRLRALAEQACNGTYGEQSLKAMEAEAKALKLEINREYNTAEYNGIKLYGDSTIATGFINEVQSRSTSGMTKLSSIDPTKSLTSGTYSISTAEELAQLATMTNNGKIGANTEFVLANDIDLKEYCKENTWTPIGASWADATSFQGVFDGNGHVISNMIIEKNPTTSSPTVYRALFSRITSTAEVKNLGLENIDISYEGATNVAGLVGRTDGGTILNCYTTGEISVGHSCGGLAGYVTSNSNIESCYSAVDLVSIEEGGDRGGLLGHLDSGSSVRNSYSLGNISAGETAAGAFGGFIGTCNNAGEIINCYSLGDIVVNSNPYVGAFISGYESSTPGLIKNCYSKGNIYRHSNAAADCTGGFIAYANNVNIEDCYQTGSIYMEKPDHFVSQFIGGSGGTVSIKNCSALGISDNIKAIYIAQANSGTQISIENCKYNSYYEGKLEIIDSIYVSSSAIKKLENNKSINYDESISLQCGINSSESSQISVDTTMSATIFKNLSKYRLNDTRYLSSLDEMINQISAKQTSFGAAENRLESALEEISTQYDNLVSSRSTLRDADIAEVSSEYIRQQILQQASATLMATANQSPSLALQLL